MTTVLLARTGTKAPSCRAEGRNLHDAEGFAQLQHVEALDIVAAAASAPAAIAIVADGLGLFKRPVFLSVPNHLFGCTYDIVVGKFQDLT